MVAYLKPLLNFAETILHEKNESFSEFPIFLKATAGMRILDPADRTRVINACRDVLGNKTYSHFKFEKEYARVISGEEEAIYGWAGANFVLGSLLKSSEGSGTVINPQPHHGTVELGGASSQITFYQPNEDVMSNLFKLQIGQGKHWNLYAHSFLYFGINEAWNRMGALISTGESAEIESTVHNPCLPGGSKTPFESSIYFVDGRESFKTDNNGNEQTYKVVLKNDENTGNYEQCAAIANALLNKKYNTWCNFAHHESCSFNGVYQPELPKQSEKYGEFLALSNYYDIFHFLGIPNRSTLSTLQNATMHLCSMDHQQLTKFNNGSLDDDVAITMCFRSTFAFELLHNGYGFQMNDNITATDVVNGQKVGWALGSMLYEINALPWIYLPKHEGLDSKWDVFGFIGSMLIFFLLGLLYICRTRPHKGREGYASITNVQIDRA